MAKLTERSRLLLTIGAAVVATGGMTALVFRDRGEIRTIEEAIQGYDERIAAADVEIRKTKDREDEVIVFREVQSRELEILPKQQEIANFHANLTTFLTNAGAKFSKLPESAPKESELARGVFVTPNTIECEADATSLLRLVNLIENDPRLVAVKGLRVKGGARAKDKDDVLEHKVSLNLETYFYAPPAKTREPVQIANLADRLEDPALRRRIVDFQPERRDSYALRPSIARRDPFVDLRREVISEDPETTRKRFEAEEGVVVDVERRHDSVREKAETEKSLSSGGQLFQYDRARTELDEMVTELRVRIANITSIRSVTFPDLASRLDKVRASVEELSAGRASLPKILRISVAVAAETRDAIEKAFRNADYPEVTTLSMQWEQFLRGKTVDEPASPLNEEIRGYKVRAKKLSEFHAKGVHVTGIIVNATSPAQSVALVNNEVRRVGEALDNKGEIRVLAIAKDGVDFAFQGEVIRVGRKDAGPKPSSGGADGGGPPSDR